MVGKRRTLLIFVFLVVLGLMSALSWLALTRPGALWLFSQIKDEAPVQLELRDFQGSLLGGFELLGLKIDWSGGELLADHLQLSWSAVGLLQRMVQIDSLRGDNVVVRLTSLAGEKLSVEPSNPELLIPEMKPLFELLGGWTLELQKLEINSLQLSPAAGQMTALQQLGGSLFCSAEQVRLNNLQLDGDYGRWRGSLQLAAAESLLSGELHWQPPVSFAPLETLDTSLSLQRTPTGEIAGPVSFAGQIAQGSGYRLSGALNLGLDGLQLKTLQFDHGSEDDGLVRGELSLGWKTRLSWQTSLALSQFNFRPEIGRVTKLDGQLDLQGSNRSYAGRINLQNAGPDWELVSLRGELQGDTQQLKLSQLEGRLLGGDIAGDISFDWREGLSSLFQLKGRALDLTVIPQAPEGNLDLQLDGWLKKTDKQGLQLGGFAQISRGVLLGRELSGELRADWQGGRQLKIEKLDLVGGWGQLKASGDLEQHLALNLELLDAAALWPSLEGAGELAGWLAWTADRPHGELTGRLKNLAYADWRAAQLVLNLTQPTASSEAKLGLQFSDLQKADVVLASLDLNAQGLPSDHRMQLQVQQNGGRVAVELQGALQKEVWRGNVGRFDLSAEQIESYRLVKPFAITLDPAELSFSEIALQGNQGGSLSLAANWSRQEKLRQVEGSWEQINLSWLKLWLAGMQFDGQSSGQGSFKQSRQGEMSFELHADYLGAFTYAGQKLQLDKAQVVGRWDQQRLAINAELLERGGGKLILVADSNAEAGFYLPQSGEIELEIKHLPLGLFNAQMPEGQDLSGLLAAKFSGGWLNQGRFSLAGSAAVAQGIFSYHDGQSRLELPFEKSTLHLDWQQTGVVAQLNLGLGEEDGLSGTIQLPLAARWPFDLTRSIPLSGEMTFRLGNIGVLSLLVPEQLADFRGEIGGALRLGGSLQKPDFAGTLELLNGRLSLRQLGILLDQIALQAVFRAQQLKIEKLSLHAGEGRLDGQGEVRFDGWKPKRFSLDLKGDNALIANLPELRALASPDLHLTGDDTGWSLAGVLKIPELQIINWHPTGPVQRSGDVVYVDQLPKPESPKSLAFKLDLDVDLGDKVVVKDRGLDVRLTGKTHLSRATQNGVFARGQIDIPAGHYSTYGVKLPITSGRLYFNGGPVDNPALDIVATRKVGEVSAGVAVGGTARQPVIRLISDPVLDDTDILSYIVLGRSTLGGSGDFSVLSLAASALLSAGDSASFQQKLKNRSGIDVIDVNTGDAGLETAVVTVGKYLTPELYLSYGRTLSSGVSQLQLRYSPSRRVDIESQLGEVSGADIYYKIEFN